MISAGDPLARLKVSAMTVTVTLRDGDTGEEPHSYAAGAWINAQDDEKHLRQSHFQRWFKREPVAAPRIYKPPGGARGYSLT
jgi:hypothetical protein